jgi:hypothetical protein
MLSQTQGHSAAGRITSMKNSNATIGNRIHDLPACSALPHINTGGGYVFPSYDSQVHKPAPGALSNSAVPFIKQMSCGNSPIKIFFNIDILWYSRAVVALPAEMFNEIRYKGYCVLYSPFKMSVLSKQCFKTLFLLQNKHSPLPLQREKV